MLFCENKGVSLVVNEKNAVAEILIEDDCDSTLLCEPDLLMEVLELDERERVGDGVDEADLEARDVWLRESDVLIV